LSREGHGQIDLFNNWKLKYNKSYSTNEEHELRFKNFQLSIKRVRDSNKIPGGATFGLTMFADLTVDEFRSTYLMSNKISPRRNERAVGIKSTNAKTPKNFDWRSKGMVTPVKNQEQCGSCWAFSATETIESAWMLKHGLTNATMTPLSPQQIVDCDNSDSGCGGGNPPTAYQYVMQAGGQETNAAYPYTGQDGNCDFVSSKVFARVSDWEYACQSGDEPTLLQNTYTYGPSSICVDAANWQDYESGIMSAWQCAWIDMLDHCVQAVGWDLTGPTPYWSVRNSWTTGWGENGYIRLQYGSNTCGLTEEATYVISA